MKGKNITRVFLITAALLLVPLIAMQFTTEVDWSPFDFIAMGVLIFSVGLAYEVVGSKKSLAYKVGVGGTLGTLFLLIWMNLAVGIIGSENNPANLLYLAVIATLVGGFISSRFHPTLLARTLFVTALVHALVPLAAFLLFRPSAASGAEVSGILQVVALNGFFVLLWVGWGTMLRRAANQ